MLLVLARSAKLFREAEVSYLKNSVAVQKILRLEIPMENRLIMAIRDPLQALRHNVPNCVLTHGCLPLSTVSPLPLVLPNQVEHRSLSMLENQIKFVADSDDLLKLDYIKMVQFSQMFDLPKTHAFVPARKLFLHFLYGNYFTRFLVNCFNDGAVSAVAYVFDDLKFVH